jgi:hypothetical protein
VGLARKGAVGGTVALGGRPQKRAGRLPVALVGRVHLDALLVCKKQDVSPRQGMSGIEKAICSQDLGLSACVLGYSAPRVR